MRKMLGIVLLLVLLAGCGGAPLDTKAPDPATAVDGRLAAASARFTFDLLKQVHQKEENRFLSPTSAAVVLSLAANGARGETQQGIWQALRYEGMTADESMTADDINEAMAALQTVLANPDPRVELTTANGIWYDSRLKLAPAFAGVAKSRYRADVKATRFASVDEINRWAAKATRERIPHLLDRIDPQTVMILVNALYFKAEWTEPFDPDNTRPGSFMRLDGTQKQVPFMFRRAHLQVLAREGVRGVRLPYGDGRLALYAIVPDRWDGFVAGLTAERWEGWLKGFENREVRLSVPRVKLTYQAELLEPLKVMSMERAADPKRADFSGLFARLSFPVYVGRVVQKTYLAIDEQGTEAAAATAVEALGGSAPPRDQPLELRLDRPFLLAIRDDVTGVILFVGIVVEP